MEPSPNSNPAPVAEPWHAPLNKVTLLSKITAAIVFIALPFVGFWFGFNFSKQDTQAVNTTGNSDNSHIATSSQNKPELNVKTNATTSNAENTVDTKSNNTPFEPLLASFEVVGLDDGTVKGKSIDLFWTVSEKIKQEFPEAYSYVTFNIHPASSTNFLQHTQNDAFVAIGDGFKFKKTQETYNYQQPLTNWLVPRAGQRYKIVATLTIQPDDFECDPNPTYRDCRPIYTEADQNLIDLAQKFVSVSDTFEVIQAAE